jgi:arylsulfatase A-like enzyme
MKLFYSLVCLVVLVYVQPVHSQNNNTVKTQGPNIIFILTDDLGYGDVGAFFQNQRKKEGDRSEPWTFTPNLDKMATEGMMLTHHYTAAPVCAPSRGSLLTGLSQGHANVRNGQFDKALADNYTLGNVLQKAGYKTAAIGKWGLQGSNRWSKNGDSWPAHPLNRGFDYYYGYMRHSDGHEHYPKEGRYRGKKEVYENKKEVSQDLDKCYTGDLWTAAAKKWIVEQTKDKKDGSSFFMYLAYDTPHAVLELPTQEYPAGGGLKGGLQYLDEPGHMINTASGKIDSWVDPEYRNATYDDDKNPSTPEVPWPDVYKRYATVTRRIDNQVGDILKLLKDLKIDDNTLVVFTSDNGPSVASYIPDEPYEANFFNSFGPFDGIKRDVLEGGERMPLIARWPNHIPENKVVTTPSIAYDWLPTFTELAGFPAPVNSDGVSLVPTLIQKGKQQKSSIYVEYQNGQKPPNYSEYAPNNRHRIRKQMQMIRFGDLVGIRYNIQSADDDFEIYNILEDTHESNNLAANGKMADVQKMMKERALQARMPQADAPRPYDNVDVPATRVADAKQGLQWSAYSNHDYPWLPQVNTLKPIAMGTVSMPDIAQLKQKGDNVYLFEGYIKVPADGDYTFYLNAANKAFMRIHDASVIDEDYDYKGGTTRDGTIKLKAGFHPIRIYYSNDPKIKNSLDIEWDGPSFSKIKVPASVFFRK